MNRMPRLLPLIAVALGGVISIKALSSIEGVPQALAGARAWAEEAPKALAKPAAKPPGPVAQPAKAPETVIAATTTRALPLPAAISGRSLECRRASAGPDGGSFGSACGCIRRRRARV